MARLLVGSQGANLRQRAEYTTLALDFRPFVLIVTRWQMAVHENQRQRGKARVCVTRAHVVGRIQHVLRPRRPALAAVGSELFQTSLS